MSQQNSRTPRDFLRAVEHKFNVRFTFDLACTTEDCVVTSTPPEGPHVNGYYHDLGVDALACDWSLIPVPRILEGLDPNPEAAGWLNCQFKHTYKYAKKCAKGTASYRVDPQNEEVDIWTPGIRIFSLFPAGVGSQWFGKHVLGQADVYCLNPRLTFIDPRTGLPFVSKKTGKAQTGLTDCILVDWNGGDQVFWWNWQDTLDEMATLHT